MRVFFTGHRGTVFSLSLSLSILAWLLPATTAAAWQPGVSDRSYGRFAEWPRTSAGVFEYYEEDLFKRVYPDGLERSSKELLESTWKVGFGWAQTTDDLSSITEPGQKTATNDLSIETLNWIRKRFVVRRHFDNGQAVATGVSSACGDGTYAVEVTSAAPGTWVSSSLRRFYIRFAAPATPDTTAPTVTVPSAETSFTHVSYVSSGTGGLATIRLDTANLQGLMADWNPSSPQSSWLLLVGDQVSLSQVGSAVIPLMLSLPPGDVESIGLVEDAATGQQYFYVDMMNLPGAERTVGMSLPFGARTLAGPAATWPALNGGEAFNLTSLQQAHRLVCNHPAELLEEFDEGAASAGSPPRERSGWWCTMSEGSGCGLSSTGCGLPGATG